MKGPELESVDFEEMLYKPNDRVKPELIIFFSLKNAGVKKI